MTTITKDEARRALRVLNRYRQRSASWEQAITLIALDALWYEDLPPTQPFYTCDTGEIFYPRGTEEPNEPSA